ncbi:unnamed protein product [Gongylonema pulchrum]|uniref:Uncharacterized protein n=1 Tax=Gongylonema pulchrum TaxID=637853 RepID=A0A183E0U4_9BILA|nr:unnamed protein product [Gongylonema pulchrum]
MHLEKVHSTAYVIDITALFISLLNFLLCLIEAVKVTYSIVTKNRARLTSGQPSLRTDRISLSAKVGSSPNSRPNSSFQTSRQLEEYLRTSPLCEESPCNSIPPHSASFGPEVSAAYSLRLSPPFRFLRSGSTNYEMGTAMFADEQGKSTSDENSVVSLVTGSRIVATEKRISLSPIPLNLIDADNELISGNDKGVASDGTDVARNAYNDSITFRVQYFIFCFDRYKLDAETLAFAERNLRSWICQTILRPLIAKIDEVNAVLAKVFVFPVL